MIKTAFCLIAVAAALLPEAAIAQPIDPSEQPTPLLQIRLAQDEENAGARRMESELGEAVFVDDAVVVDDSHIQSLRTSRTATGLTLFIDLDEEGASLIGRATRGQIGKRLAIFLNSRLLAAPKVVSEIAPRMLLELPLPENEVASVDAAFQARFARNRN